MRGKITSIENGNVTVDLSGVSHTYDISCVRYKMPEAGDPVILTKNSDGVSLDFDNDREEQAQETPTRKYNREFSDNVDIPRNSSDQAFLYKPFSKAIFALSVASPIIALAATGIAIEMNASIHGTSRIITSFLIFIVPLVISVFCFYKAYLYNAHKWRDTFAKITYILSGITMGFYLFMILTVAFGIIGIVIFLVIAVLAVILL